MHFCSLIKGPRGMPGERGRIGPQGAPVSRVFLLCPCNSSLALLTFKSLSVKGFIRVVASHFHGALCSSLKLGSEQCSGVRSLL